ncbi:uncharacterized protein LOC128647630 [Bombina bombina]|uniref:uncharacterized protein LOC128647630 n=1 Tax=Bombina bombina TaxID=8345 RepID=UPI00235AA4CD|nr:uncharacterized protein LOC128647630 [Bombina bombina]
MDPARCDSSSPRRWTVAETHSLLDLIRDLGLVPVLTRKGYPNWDIFERLHVILKRCNVRASSVAIKDRWQWLKVKFWRLKRLADSGVAPISGIIADFQFYEEMEQLLVPQKRSRGCVREADSTRQDNTLSDSGFLSEEDELTDVATSRIQVRENDELSPRQEAAELEAAPEREAEQQGAADHNMEPMAGVVPVFAQEDARVLLSTMQQLLSAMERLMSSVEQIAGSVEQISAQLGYLCSLLLQMDGQARTPKDGHQAQGQGGGLENIPVAHGTRSSRLPRRSLRHRRPSVRYFP